MSPKGGGGGGRSGSNGKDEVVAFTFLRYRRIRDVAWRCRYGHAKGRGSSSYINAAWLQPTKGREGCNGRMGDGDKTTFGHTQSGRHKYAKASRRPGLKGAVHLLDQNDEFVR